MCNDFGNHIPYSVYVEEFSQLRLPVNTAASAVPNLEPRDEIWPTDTAVVFRPVPGGVALEQHPWGLAPARTGARAVINMRAEGRRFANGRCLVPASHYYEFTGTRSPKTRWRFTQAGRDWFCFAGLLGRGPAGEAFTVLTVDAGPDVQPYHTRQPVVLDRTHWAAWLDGAEGLLQPSPAGSLVVAQAPRAPDKGMLL
jgi:putative SOS response-associated peptidase YedK